MTEKKQEQQSLDSFEWDDGNSFFGVEVEKEEENIVDVVKKDDEEEDSDKKKESKDESKVTKDEKNSESDVITKKDDEKNPDNKDEDDEDKATFFDNKDNDENSNNDQNENSEPTKEEKTIVDELLESGLFTNVEIKEDEELTVEKLLELQEQEKELYAKEVVEGLIDEADEEGKLLLKFMANGGKAKDFIASYSNSFDVSDMDLEDETNQDKIIKYYLEKYEDTASDDIDDRLEWLDENGKKKKYAEKYKEKIEAITEEQRKKLLKKQEDSLIAQENKRLEYVNTFKETLDSVDVINDLPITKTDKKVLKDFATKRSIKIGKNKFITPLQKKVAEYFNDAEKLILLSKFMYSDFDMKEIETKTATKIAKKVKDKVLTTRTKRSSSGAVKRNRSLSDFFN